MTNYVNRRYEIADQFRAKGVPVFMGGVHPSFMSHEALKHASCARGISTPPLIPLLRRRCRLKRPILRRRLP
jgi:hypothetical protein